MTIGEADQTGAKMVRAWFMDSSEEDQRLEHQQSPPKSISLDDLFKTAGILYWKVSRLSQKRFIH